MYYSKTEHDGRKFVCFVPKTSGLELSPDERNFIVQSLPVEGEWIEGIWDYVDDDIESILEATDILEEGGKAINFLNDCIQDGLLDDE